MAKTKKGGEIKIPGGHVSDNERKFREVYAVKLAEAIARDVKATARALGVKPTLRAIMDYLKEPPPDRR